MKYESNCCGAPVIHPTNTKPVIGECSKCHEPCEALEVKED